MRRAILVNTSSAYLTLEQVIEETGAREELIAELENYGIVQPEKRRRKESSTTRPTARSSRRANELSRFGVGARNMRVFRTSADRESNLLEAVLGLLAAVPQSRAPQGSPRKPGEPCGDGQPPQAPAPGQGPAPARRQLSRAATADAARLTKPDHRGPAGDVWELVSDPYSLPRWWPRTARVESVEAKASGRRTEWTKVLETSEGRGVRADFRCLSSARYERYVWEQQLAGTPFDRHLRSSKIEIALRGAGEATEVRLASEQSLRGMSRLGSPMMRRGQAEILDEALDGIERALSA